MRSAASSVYLDHNATTPVHPEVLEAMLPFLREDFANPNSVHGPGQRVRRAIEEARESVARLIGADPAGLVFTSCGSEANAFALRGALGAAREPSSSRAVPAASPDAGAPREPSSSRAGAPHLVTSAIEHDSIRELLGPLRAEGFSVTVVGADSSGRVSAAEVESALRPETALVSLMHANNETGVLQPVREVGELCRARGVLFHCDAVQSVGKVPVDVQGLGADLLSLSGHKFNAPKGVGALWVRPGARLSALIAGHQEKNRRGGTENAASIVGLGRAAELAARDSREEGSRLRGLRERLERGVLALGGARLSGEGAERLPGTVHVCFEGLRGHELVVALDLEGFCVSGGPACAAGRTKVSHVLSAMGVGAPLAQGALRLSLGRGSTGEEVERLLAALPALVSRLRDASGAETARA